MAKRSETYTRENEAPYFARCRRDAREADARGWTSIGMTTICDPPCPSGVPPVGHDRRAFAESLQPGGGAIRLPDYGDGEDGGYQHAAS